MSRASIGAGLVAVLSISVSSCAGLMMSVEDRAGSDSSIVLSAGTEVAVAQPTFAPQVIESRNDDERSELASALVRGMLEALDDRGMDARPGEDGPVVLRIRITEFSGGSGVARWALSGTGVGDSKLDGIAILMTPAGRRELLVRKSGSESGVTEIGDQTAENIDYFTTALASTLVG